MIPKTLKILLVASLLVGGIAATEDRDAGPDRSGTFPDLTGHGAGEEELRALMLVADWTHVWAASSWIGGLALVLYMERGWRREHGPDGSLLPAMVPVFSKVAIVSAATLLW